MTPPWGLNGLSDGTLDRHREASNEFPVSAAAQDDPRDPTFTQHPIHAQLTRGESSGIARPLHCSLVMVPTIELSDRARYTAKHRAQILAS